MKKSLAVLIALPAAVMMLSGCAPAGTQAQPEEVKTEEAKEDTEEEKEAEPSKKKSKTKNKTLADKLSKKAQETQEDVDYAEVYAPVINETLAMIDQGPDYDGDEDFESTGLYERILYPEGDDLKEVIGYVLTDIDGDGVTELLIGENEDYEYDNTGEQTLIYSGYTVKDKKPVRFLEGWARNRQYYLGEGHFFNSGSGGASNSIFGEWHLGADGEIEWDDLYFTEEDAQNGGLALFHNKTGSLEPTDSEKLTISEDEFFGIEDDYMNKCELISWSPLSGWENGESSEDASSSGSIEDLNVGVYGVFVTAQKDRDKCETVLNRLEDAGYDYTPVIYTPDYANLNPEPYYVVSAGLFATEKEAEDVLSDVKASGFKEAYVKFTGEYIGEKYSYTMIGTGGIEILKDCVILHDVEVNHPYYLEVGPVKTDLIVDEDTVFDKTAEMEYFGNYEKGMSPYKWIVKNYNLAEEDSEEYMAHGPALSGVFEVGISGDRIKTYYGSYWWD